MANAQPAQESRPEQPQPWQSDDLQNIYSTLRKLEQFKAADLKFGGRDDSVLPNLSASLFPRRFLLKTLEERLLDLDDLASEISATLFRHIGGRPRRVDNVGAEKKHGAKHVKFADLDEYFHLSLHHLHDFFLDLDWHESDVEVLTQEDLDYARNKLKNVDNLLRFMRVLNNYVQYSKVGSARSTTSSGGTKFKTLSPKSPDSPKLGAKKSLKSSLTVPRWDSPTSRRRVRFQDAKSTSSRATSTSTTTEKRPSDKRPHRLLPENRKDDLRANHSLFAFNLLLFALNLLIQQLSNKLFSWSESEQIHEEIKKTLLESRQKLRTRQLEVLATRLKISNDVYLTVLDYFAEIKETYLSQRVSSTLIANEPERLLALQKEPRIRVYIERIGLDVEQKILGRLAKQCLQIFLDLIVSELNLPPVELESSTKTKSREEVARSQENILNFVTNWLGVDDVLFGSRKTKEQRKESEKSAAFEKSIKGTSKKKIEVSSLHATGMQLKSSSRILSQMDNLSELIRVFLTSIVQRLRNQQLSTYFIRLVYAGFNEALDMTAAQLIKQLVNSKADGKSVISSGASEVRQQSEQPDDSVLSKHIDSIGAKIRCLKLIHIFSSANKIILDLSDVVVVNLMVNAEESIEHKLNKFTETCTRQTSSSFKI